MSLREFLVPAEEELLDTLGMESEPVEGESTVRRLRLTSETGDVLTVIYDLPGKTVQVRWERKEELLVDIVREGACRLVVENRADEARLVTNFENGGFRAELMLQFQPFVRIVDRLLFI